MRPTTIALLAREAARVVAAAFILLTVLPNLIPAFTLAVGIMGEKSAIERNAQSPAIRPGSPKGEDASRLATTKPERAKRPDEEGKQTTNDMSAFWLQVIGPTEIAIMLALSLWFVVALLRSD